MPLNSYLRGRNKFFQPQYKHSPSISINTKVPHGSMIGPLFFIIDMNDILNSIPHKLFMCADNKTPCLTNRSLQQVKLLWSPEYTCYICVGARKLTKLSWSCDMTPSSLALFKIKLCVASCQWKYSIRIWTGYPI